MKDLITVLSRVFVFVELFAVTCTNIFMLKVSILSMLWCSCVVTVKFCVIETILKVCCRKLQHVLVDCITFLHFILLFCFELVRFTSSSWTIHKLLAKVCLSEGDSLSEVIVYQQILIV